MKFLLRLFFVLYFTCIYVGIYADFKIVEVFPNTVRDSELEYVKIQNTSGEEKSLSGYTLSDLKKEFVFGDVHIENDEFYTVTRPETKIALNNSDETLYLHNSNGELIDTVSYKDSNKGEVLYFDVDHDIGDDLDSGEETLTLSPGALWEKIEFQRPSYATKSGTGNTYLCSGNQDSCKINFNFEDIFHAGFSKSDHICSTDFGFTGSESESGKCNPNTLSFPIGETNVLIDILSKSNNEIVESHEMTIIYDPSAREDSKNNIVIFRPEVSVQSGLTGKGRYFYCEKLECKINLEYKKRQTGERCIWRFRKGIASSKTTHTRCNPGYVEYGEGIHELSLRVYESGNMDNKKIFRFYVYNTPEQYEEQPIPEPVVWRKGEDSLLLSGSHDQVVGEKTDILIDEVPQLTEAIESSIVLQGKIGKEKMYSGSLLECHNVASCYVNFDGQTSIQNSDMKYAWTLGGRIFSTDRNPKGIWVDAGSHEIKFYSALNGKILDTQNFSVVVSESIDYESKIDTTQKQNKDTKIPFTQNILVLKYDGLRISGKAPAGSTIEILRGEEKILSGATGETGKYRIVSKGFTPGEIQFNTKLTLRSGEEIFIENSSSKDILTSDIAYWHSSPSKNSKTTDSKPKLFTIKQGHAEGSSDQHIPVRRITEKILMVFVLSIAGFIGILHLLFIHYSHKTVVRNFDIYTLQFVTRQKVLLEL